MENIRIQVKKWWISLSPPEKRDIERKEFGEPYEFEPNDLGEIDIIHLFKKYSYDNRRNRKSSDATYGIRNI